MSKTIITIKSNSAIKIEGDFEIRDMEGNVYGLDGRKVVSLCRCGLSKTMPFCDGAHKGNFQDEAKAWDWADRKKE